MKSNNNGGIVELLIPTFLLKKASHGGQKLFYVKKLALLHFRTPLLLFMTS